MRIKFHFDTLTLRARIMLLIGVLVLATLFTTTRVVKWSTRRFVEDAIGDQMVMQAWIAAHLVAIAEQKRPNGMTAAEINEHLREIMQFAKQEKTSIKIIQGIFWSASKAFRHPPPTPGSPS